MFEKYVHFKNEVWVRSELKGKHREHCLCHSCVHFTPEDRGSNCVIANSLYVDIPAKAVFCFSFISVNFSS